MVDVQSVINWAVVSQLSRWTIVVYHTDRQPLSIARFCRVGQFVTADTCYYNYRPSSHAVAAEINFVVETVEHVSTAVFQPVNHQLHQQNTRKPATTEAA